MLTAWLRLIYRRLMGLLPSCNRVLPGVALRWSWLTPASATPTVRSSCLVLRRAGYLGYQEVPGR